VNIQRRVIKVTKTRRAIRAEEEAARKAKRREREIEMYFDGTRDRVLEETGVDLLAGTGFSDQPQPKLSHWGTSDGGAAYDSDAPVFDARTPSQALSDDIRVTLSDPKRQRERARLKAGGSPDARDVPDDGPSAVSYPRVPWERDL
jgi:hypothetical protein